MRADNAVIGLIWAQGTSGVIGSGGSIPWRLPEDLSHFSKITSGHPVIMGRRTWESLPEAARPLPGRTNIVVTSNPDFTAPGAVRAGNLYAALIEASMSGSGSEQIWIIGGASLYREALSLADTVVITRVDLDVEGDTFAPGLGPEWELEEEEPASGVATAANGVRYRYERWTSR
ncbi:dihydrofolate reductase [Arthrobacter sp. zg-Y1110]|nr:dihydrofolate reductase [Arthrobacter sp. zg-Y1110]UWX87165.1 dihydrofolate reductase [Arthrobacter sp. zg-Y1110]